MLGSIKLDSLPLGDWFCSRCTVRREKQAKRAAEAAIRAAERDKAAKRKAEAKLKREEARKKKQEEKLARAKQKKVHHVWFVCVLQCTHCLLL